jgi:hypothetical protein
MGCGYNMAGLLRRSTQPLLCRNSVYLRCASGGKCGDPNTAESLVIDGVAADVSYTGMPEDWLDKVTVELRKRYDN